MNKWSAAWLLANKFGHGWATYPFPTKSKKLLRVFKNWKPSEDSLDTTALSLVIEEFNEWPSIEGRPPKTELEAKFCEALNDEINRQYCPSAIAGLSVSTQHTTVTGRVVWDCEDKETTIKINRPRPLGDSSPITVLRAVVPYTRGATVKITQHSDKKKIIDFTNPNHGIPKTIITGPEPRHWEALE